MSNFTMKPVVDWLNFTREQRDAFDQAIYNEIQNNKAFRIWRDTDLDPKYQEAFNSIFDGIPEEFKYIYVWVFW